MLFAFSMIHILKGGNNIVQFVVPIFEEYMHIELKIV
jgi:hypothetical protein